MMSLTTVAALLALTGLILAAGLGLSRLRPPSGPRGGASC